MNSKKYMLRFLLLLLFSFNSFVQAQDKEQEPILGKKGQVILPEQGDIGVAVNLIPFFYLFGNAFNSNANNTYGGNDKFFQIFGNSVIVGRYMLTDKTAFRWAWGINFGHIDEDQYVRDDASNDPDVWVKDSRSTDYSSASLSLGWEMRRGKGRFQGFFGVDGVVTYNQSDDYRYYYGNGYSQANQIPTSYDWGNNLNGNTRKTKDTGFNVLGVGVRPFVGAEYFIAPKLSIGVEFGWALMFRHTLAITVSEEYFEPSTGNVLLDETFVGATNSFDAGVDNFNGVIYVSFYFDGECGKKSGGSSSNATSGKTAKDKKSSTGTKKKDASKLGNSRF